MSIAAPHSPLISPEEYLSGEEASAQKHEYLNGVVYAMAGGTQRHNKIAGNIFAALHNRLRGKPCHPYASDMLVRVQSGDDLRFYYPDVSIICRPAGPEARIQENPSVIFEVLSDSTARTDTGEKRMAYLTIPTLEALVLVDARKHEVTVWRHGADGWGIEVFTASGSTLAFSSADCALTLGEIYERSEF
jgi:Uma2 family endonuclease